VNQTAPRVHGIVFSYNRAMQLDATLHSFYLHCQDAHLVQLTVLYKADNPRHARHYQILASDYPQVAFRPEKNFRRDTLKILTAGLSNPFVRLWLQCFSYLINTRHIHMSFLRRTMDRQAHKMQRRIASQKHPFIDMSYVLFLVDDNIFVGNFLMSEVIKPLESHIDVLGFSLRLGKNTSYSYTRDAYQRLPSFLPLDEKVLSYAWPGADFNFGYPLEVSSSVFCTRLIAPLVSTLQFHQPNKLESRMAACSDLFRETYPHLLCFETSVTFCNPVNMVQHSFPNRAGESVAFTVRDLAERFERGERIDVKALDGFVPNSCHQEVEFGFK
jgi:hypothetical protein